MERGPCHVAALSPLCVLAALETQGIRFCYAKDDDSFLAAVSRGWSKHFPKIAGKRERNPMGGTGTEGRGADQSRTAEQKKTERESATPPRTI